MSELAGKTFVGPRLRQLRRQKRQTQAQVAKTLGVSPAYITLLESNQRSLSVQMLMRLSDAYDIDWRDLISDDSALRLNELRMAFQDPVFSDEPDLQELRAAVDHSPTVVENFLMLQKNYRRLAETVMRDRSETGREGMVRSAPEGQVHDYFKQNKNHFPLLEKAANKVRKSTALNMDVGFATLKQRLLVTSEITVEVLRMEQMDGALRFYDAQNKRLAISEALDHQNKIFQLAHIVGLVEFGPEIEELVTGSKLDGDRALERLRVELANYFAAALLMPYGEFLLNAQESRYDLELIATRFGVSFEQAAHRLTTLQADNNKGIPFFFLRVDKAGNVTKRFNATSFQLAEYGGACPAWNMHTAFRTPGRIITQRVEMPDGAEFFTLCGTSERPYNGQSNEEERRLVIALGCPIEFASELIYAEATPETPQPIGINCHLCSRQGCSQRAHQALYMDLPIDPSRRGSTRYES
ncbi:MAG: short-chain fatty acyl-CoA regulator family protein [Pseudomonadota bacterium]